MSKIINREKSNYKYLSKPIEIITFENGHKLILAYKKSKLVNISSWCATGSINENADNNGVSHFLEHLMFKGTHKYKAGEFDKTMERNGGSINAATWKDYTFYYVTIPHEHFELALKMHADMMIDPVVPDSEIGSPFDVNGEEPADKRERHVVIEEIRMGKDNNWRKVYNSLNDIMYEKHPYKRNVIGTAEIISRISRNDILNYYKSFYTSDNIVTVITGDIDFEKTIELVQSEFKFQNFTDYKKLTPDEKIPEYRIKNPKIVENTALVNSGYMMFGFLADRASNIKESLALSLISIILGEGKSSRLNLNLIEKVEKPVVYEVESCVYDLREGSNFMIDINFDASHKEEVIELIKKELDNLVEISDVELNKAKKALEVMSATYSEKVSTLGSQLGEIYTVSGNLDYLVKAEDVLNEIDTDYIKSIVQKYLNKEYASISILMPAEEN